MDVTQISHLYRPSIGGIENYGHRLCESLRARGHGAAVITTDASLRNDRSPLAVEADVAYCRTDVAPFRNPLSRELYRRVRASDADVYHLHSLWYLTSLTAVRALRDRRRRDADGDGNGDASPPVVMTLHGFQPIQGPVGRLLEAAWRPFARYVLRNVDRTIVLGRSEKRRLVEEYDADPDRVVVVPNGIDPDEHAVDPEAVEAFRRTYDLDPTKPTLLFVGRLVPLKRPDLLVRAVAEHLPDVDCQVVVIGHGEGAYAESLVDRADDRFRFLSNLPFEELLAAYGAADAFVLLSAAEGLPTVVLEAMNAGLPVVTTPAGALADVVVDGEHGRLLSAEPTAVEVGDAIRGLLSAPDRLRAIGERNRAYVRDAFSWESVADRIVGVYEDVLAERGGDVDVPGGTVLGAGTSGDGDTNAGTDPDADPTVSTVRL